MYLEWIGGRGWGPGFGFSEVRIYLDREVVGREWELGSSIGICGKVGPAVAVLREGLALRVDGKKEHLELVRLTEPGVPNQRPMPERMPRTRRTVASRSMHAGG